MAFLEELGSHGCLQKKNGLRETYSLNQLWQFAPADGSQNLPDSWGYFVVPGHWTGGNISNTMLSAQGVPLERWKEKPVRDFSQARYRRTFHVPEDWKSKQVLLQFEVIKGVASVYINGKPARTTPMGSGIEVEAGELLDWGRDNEISVFIEKAPNQKDPRLGIFGDTWLAVRPPVNIGVPRIVTSVRKKGLTLHLDRVPEKSAVKLRVLDEGKEIAAMQWSSQTSGEYRFSWMPQALWSPESPKLYDAEITLVDAEGKILDQSTTRFGFREFWVESGRFVLNGRDFLLKSDSAVETAWSPDWMLNDDVFRDDLALARKMGLNAFLMSPETPERLYDIADQEGFLLLQKGLLRSHVERDQADKTPKWWDNFEEEVKKTLGNPLLRNHPSVVAWIIDIWYNFHSGTATPEYIGMESTRGPRLMLDVAGNPEARQNVLDPNLAQGLPQLRKAHLDRVVELCRKYAPEFEYFTNGSGHVGDVFSTHIYHTWGAPRSELRALFERWKQDRTLPVYAGEISQPYILAFYDLEKAASGQPLFLENGARFFGNKAYLYDGVYTLKPFHDLTRDGVFANQVDSAGHLPFHFMPDIFLDVMADYTGSLFPAWRADGFSGFGTFGYVREGHWAVAGIPSGAIAPELPKSLSRPGYAPQSMGRGDAITVTANPYQRPPEFRENIVAPPFRRALEDLTLLVSGNAQDAYLEDHAFFAGSAMTRTAIVANNTDADTTVHLKAALLNSEGRLMEKQEFTLSIKAGGQQRQIVSFKAPQVDGRSGYHLEFVLSHEGSSPKRAVMDVEVFPRRPWLQPSKELHIFDPEGILAKRLEEKGIKFDRVKALKDPLEGGVLIIGRNALSETVEKFDPNEFVKRGVNVLILEQQPETSAELIKVRQREAHIEAPEHPVLAGLKDEDFKNWSGSHGNSPAYAPTQPGLWWSDWSNRNMVSTSVFRRPCWGNFISLLASGFDLFESPLLECRGQRASWIACQLDVTERLESDPVAALLVQRLITYLSENGQSAGTAALFSDSAVDGFLEKCPISAERLGDLSATALAAHPVLVIRHPDFEKLSKYENLLSDYVYWGGRIVYLQEQENFDSRWLPFPMGIGRVEARQAVVRNPGWNLGWGNSDLYWRDKTSVPVFTGFPAQFDATDPAVVVRRKYGAGEYWFVSISPELFKNTTAAAKTCRLLSSILVQNGVLFEGSENPYRENGKAETLDLTQRKWEFRTDPKDQGLSEEWQRKYQPEGWLKGLIADGVEVRVGTPWESFLGNIYEGVAWYRLTFEFPKAFPMKKDIFLNLGPIDDLDQVYFNGQLIGHTDKATPKWWEANRIYGVPAKLLKPDGPNMIAVRVVNLGGIGGIKRGPVFLSTQPPLPSRAWTVPYPGSDARDYDYNPDVVRMY